MASNVEKNREEQIVLTILLCFTRRRYKSAGLANETNEEEKTKETTKTEQQP
jgi:hypothetical protein